MFINIRKKKSLEQRSVVSLKKALDSTNLVQFSRDQPRLKPYMGRLIVPRLIYQSTRVQLAYWLFLHTVAIVFWRTGTMPLAQFPYKHPWWWRQGLLGQQKDLGSRKLVQQN